MPAFRRATKRIEADPTAPGAVPFVTLMMFGSVSDCAAGATAVRLAERVRGLKVRIAEMCDV